MPSRDRERALARAKLERRMQRRAEAARKRRRIFAGIGAVVGVALVATLGVWLISSGGDEKESSGAVCSYQDVANPVNVKDVGKPSEDDIPDEGTRDVTIETSAGTVHFTMNLEQVPCTANSWEFLAGKQYYDNLPCPRLTDALVQCGAPPGDGENPLSGGPGYEYGTENLPVGRHPAYPKGTVAMAKAEAPISVGSQFFIMLADQDLGPDYTVVGKIGEEEFGVLDALLAIGHDGSFDPNPGGGAPNEPITLTSVRVA